MEAAIKTRFLYGYTRENEWGGHVRQEILRELFFKDLKMGASNFSIRQNRAQQKISYTSV